MRIIVVCGAGASSTFVAHRIRSQARTRGLDVDVRPASESSLAEALVGADVLLLGAHLASHLGAIGGIASAASVPLAVLPDTAATDDGAAALDLALSVAGGGK